MNMRPKLQLEPYNVDMLTVAGFQSYIRRAVIEDNEDCARFLDAELKDNHVAKIAALHIAQILYELRNQTEPVKPGVVPPALPDPFHGFHCLTWSPWHFQGYHIFMGDRTDFFETKCDGIPLQVSSREQASKFRDKLRSKTRNMKTTRTPKVINLPAPGQLLVQLRLAI